MESRILERERAIYDSLFIVYKCYLGLHGGAVDLQWTTATCAG